MRFSCPSCNQLMQCADDLGGAQVSCIRCAKLLLVPSSPAATVVPGAPAAGGLGDRFPLRMTRDWQIFTGVGLTAFGLLTVVGLVMALDGLGKHDNATLAKGLAVSAGMGCVAAFFGVNFYAREKGGYVAVGPDGVFLDTFLSIGFIPWSNLKAVAVVDMGNENEVLAVCLNDPAAFIATRTTVTGEMSTAFRYYNAVMRAAFEANSYTLAWLIKPARVVEKIIGTKYIPQSGEEIHLMESNRQVTGYHILIPSYWFEAPRDVVALVAARTPAR